MANTADVLILGGGVIGLAIARSLMQAGLTTLVLDRGATGRASTAAAGMLSTPHKDVEGAEFFELCLRSRSLYPQFVEDLRVETNIDVELLRWGTLELLNTEPERQVWTRRAATLRKDGVAAEVLKTTDLLRLEPKLGEAPFGAVLLHDDHHLNNEELHRALRQSCSSLKVRHFESSPVQKLLLQGDRVLGARTATETWTAAETIVAGGAWTSALMEDIGLVLPLVPIRGQMLAIRSEPQVRHILSSGDGYMVPRLTGEILCGSTLEDVGFALGNTLAGTARLSQLALRFVPSLGAAEISRSWSAFRPRTPDALPVLGRFDSLHGLCMATGHYRNGILLTPVTAKVVTDILLQGKSDIDPRVFGPDRFRRTS